MPKDKNLTAYQQVGNRWTGVEVEPGTKAGNTIGTGKPILVDAPVHKAVAYGIDRATLVKKRRRLLTDQGVDTSACVSRDPVVLLASGHEQIACHFDQDVVAPGESSVGVTA